MAVKLRLSRFGRMNHPTYRVCAVEAEMKRDGRVVETLGYYLPKHVRADEQFRLNAERIQYWLSVGAQPSETVRSLIRKSGIELPQKTKRKKTGSKSQKPKTFSPPRALGKGRLAKKKWDAKHRPQASAATKAVADAGDE